MSSHAKSAAKIATSRDDALSKFPNIVRSATEAEARLAARAEEAVGSQLSLPFWAEQFRALPSEIFRSALFNARNKTKAREHMKDREIVVIGPGTITYTGEELRQDDETVWLQLIQLAKTQPLGRPIQFTANSFLKAIDWPRPWSICSAERGISRGSNGLNV